MAKKRDDAEDELAGIGCLSILLSIIPYFLVYWIFDVEAAVYTLFFSAIIIFVILIILNEYSKTIEEKERKDRLQELKEQIKKSKIEEIDLFDGHSFERYLGIMYESLGYKVLATKGSGDFGADLILKKEGKIIAVQAKRYNKSVGVRAVQEIIAALGYYKADEGWVVTNNYFTKAAKELAATSNVRLVDRTKLISEIVQSQDRENDKLSNGETVT